MKVVLSLAAVLALAVSLNVVGAHPADAGCLRWRCGGAVLVPPPNPIPLARPCGWCGAPVAVAPCGGCGAPVAVAPRPCAGGCGRAYYYAPSAYYAYWAQPPYLVSCGGPGNCYWRRDCWYDSFGRRFCN